MQICLNWIFRIWKWFVVLIFWNQFVLYLYTYFYIKPIPADILIIYYCPIKLIHWLLIEFIALKWLFSFTNLEILYINSNFRQLSDLDYFVCMCYSKSICAWGSRRQPSKLKTKSLYFYICFIICVFGWLQRNNIKIEYITFIYLHVLLRMLRNLYFLV